jgi:hypothetical protein
MNADQLTSIQALRQQRHNDDRAAAGSANGDLDVRGTLAVAEKAAVECPDIRLHFDLDSVASAAQSATRIRLTGRHSALLQAVPQAPAMSVVEASEQRAPCL